LEHGATKIRSTSGAGKPRVKDAHRFAVQGAQFIPVQALVLPDGLEQTLGRRVRIVAQRGCRAVAPPLRVEIRGSMEHL
jgi:hypothetical protein